MSGGGGKGGSQSTQVKLPGWLNSAAQRTVQRGEQAARIGYTPFTGPDVAAFAPGQNAAFQGADAASAAFGLPGGAGAGGGMPAPTTFAGGVQGYGSHGLYQQALAGLPQGQYDAIRRMFVNPQTGAAPASPVLPRR